METPLRRRRMAGALALATLLTVMLMVPVAADNDHDQRDGNDQQGVNDQRDSNAQRDVVERCSQSIFRVASDVDVSSGSIVGGPYSGWPVVVVSDAGQGLPVGMDVAVPPNVVPFGAMVNAGLGLGQAVPPAPALTHFQVTQQVLAGGTFDTARQSLILLARPDIIAFDSCQQ